MADRESEHTVSIPAWEGPVNSETGPGTEHEPGTFVARIEDQGVRHRLAAYVSTNIFYHHLDEGYGLDEALARSIMLGMTNKKFLDSFVESGEVPDNTWPEEQWHVVLDQMEAEDRPNYEPGKVRKALGSFILRQELAVGDKHIIDLAPWRKRSPTVSEGIV